MIATFINVLEPATASAATGSDPAAMAPALKLSYHFPIKGRINETENMPAPPISDSPRAPVLGRYSDTKPSIVGQKKQMPDAKTSAAPKAPYPLALLSSTRPMAASPAE